jgi:hypothetical protein
MNCYRRDYLQVAFVDPFLRKLIWYKCPSEGGKIAIPRWVGWPVRVACISVSYD